MKSVAIYVWRSETNRTYYGSEIAVINLAEELRKKNMKVYIVVSGFKFNAFHGFDIISHDRYEQMVFDVTIISRYANFYYTTTVRSPLVYLWLHDILINPAFSVNHKINHNAKFLMQNVKCDGLVVQTQWHKNIIEKVYGLPTSIIGNGINVKNFMFQREPSSGFRFIWTSSPVRGLAYMLEIFPQIRAKYPESKLHIFRGGEEMTPRDKELIEKYSEFVVYEGFRTSKELSVEFLKSDVWLYPTDFNETFCISAVEAQAAGCLCICSDLAALSETVGERGILLKSEYKSREYIQEIFDGLEKLFANRDEYSRKGREWALRQSWASRADQWINLFDDSHLLKEEEKIELDTLPWIGNDCEFPSGIHVEVINLNRRPDRLERTRRALSGRSKVPFTKFEAIDARELQITTEIAALLDDKGYPQKNPYKNRLLPLPCPEVAVLLSHLKIWEGISSGEIKSPTIILEDDNFLVFDFNKKMTDLYSYLSEHQPDWDLCFLGYTDDIDIYNDTVVKSFDGFNLQKFNGDIPRVFGGGMFAYLLSQAGANKIIQLKNKYGIPQPVDWFVIEMASFMNVFKCHRNIIYQDEIDTDIQL